MIAYQIASCAERVQHVSEAFLAPSQEHTFQVAKAQSWAVSHLSSINITIHCLSSTLSLELSSFSTSATSPGAALVEQTPTPAQLDEQQQKEHKEDHINAQLELK